MHAPGHTDRIFEAQFATATQATATRGVNGSGAVDSGSGLGGSGSGSGGLCVTVGVKHVAFWSFENNVLSRKKGRFGGVGPLQTMLCVACGADGTT
jgi:hypothetical protein